MTSICVVQLFTILPLLLNVAAQPGNSADGKSNLTGNEVVKKVPPVLQLVNNTEGNVIEKGSPEAHSTSCIKSLVDLRQAYLDCKTAPWSSPKDSTIYSFYPTDAVRYTTLAIVYDLSTEEIGDQPANYSSKSNECCNSANANRCKVFFRYQSHLYRAIDPSLIFLYAFPTAPNKVGKLRWFEERMHRYKVHELCWKVPPMCTEMFLGNGDINKALQAFTAEFPHLVLSASEGPIQVGPVDQYQPGHWEEDKLEAISNESKLALNFVVLCVFIAVIPLLLFAMDTYSTTISTVLIKSKFAAKVLLMVMFQSWFWTFFWLFNTVQILRTLLHTVQESKKYLYDLLMPDVVLCFTSSGVQLAVILIEIPFVCSYIWKSPVIRGVYERKSGKPLLLKIRKAAETMGWMGIVVFCQAGSVMVCYMVMFLFIDPLYTITRMGMTALMVLITAALALCLGLCCANCCSCALCTCQKFCKYFSVAMVLLVITSIGLLTLLASPEPFTTQKDSMVSGILSSIVSSAMLALSGYICKKLVWNKITQEVREFDQVSQSGIDGDDTSNDMLMLSVSAHANRDK